MAPESARPKLAWIVGGICIYIAFCVVGFLYLFTDSPTGVGSMSTGRFLFLLLVVAPIGASAYALGEGLLEAALNAIGRGIRAWRRK